MKEQKIYLFDNRVIDKASAICLCHNGELEDNNPPQETSWLAPNGELFDEFENRWPELPWLFGTLVDAYGLDLYYTGIITSPPVIFFPAGNISQIEKSCYQLMELIEDKELTLVALPLRSSLPDGLDWETQVKPLVSELLDDRVVIVSGDK